jgi:hypothetical protein
MAARPTDNASLMEASRYRLAISRTLCRTTAVIIRETRETVDRTIERLDPRPEAGSADKRRN